MNEEQALVLQRRNPQGGTDFVRHHRTKKWPRCRLRQKDAMALFGEKNTITEQYRPRRHYMKTTSSPRTLLLFGGNLLAHVAASFRITSKINR